MRLLALVLALLLTACASRDAPPPVAVQQRNIHALIVGIDRYEFSRDHTRGADFSDLSGAVGDARRFAAALTELYAVAPAPAASGACPGPAAAAAAQMLLNECATRTAILAALDAAIDARKPGETLLFYFAGHGSRYRDDETFAQDTGYNGTILPFDARNPDGSPGDIFDVELKLRKDRAVAKGVYFVSIFDSCNSATATRDGAAGAARSVPEFVGALPLPPTLLPPTSPDAPGGYWVHMAAAQDGEEAQETPSGAVGARAGVFTSALIDTLHAPGMVSATFGDIIREVQLRVAQRGHAAQTPSAEGRLTASFGARSRSAVLYAVRADKAAVTLAAGRLSGITAGSSFALYPDQAAALAHSGQLASASVASVGDAVAVLTLGSGAKLPERMPEHMPEHMVAEEIAHFFPPDAMALSNDLPPGAARDAVGAALRAAGFIAAGGAGATRIALADGRVVLRADDGTVLADKLGSPGDPGLAAALKKELQKIARVRQLLALRTATAGGESSAGAPLDFCIAADGYRVSACPAPDAGGMRKLAGSGRFTAAVINRGTRPVFVYLLAIDPRNAVDLILPAPGEIDRKLRVGAVNARARRNMEFKLPGAYRFIAIASDIAIRADAFEQSGNGTRDIDPSPLERLLRSANAGTRDTGIAAVGNWSAQVATAIVESKPAP